MRVFCRIVSFTAAKTSRIFVVSVACVKLEKTDETAELREAIGTYCGYTLSLARFTCMNFHNMYLAALLMSAPPVYSGK